MVWCGYFRMNASVKRQVGCSVVRLKYMEKYLCVGRFGEIRIEPHLILRQNRIVEQLCVYCIAPDRGMCFQDLPWPHRKRPGAHCNDGNVKSPPRAFHSKLFRLPSIIYPWCLLVFTGVATLRACWRCQHVTRRTVNSTPRTYEGNFQCSPF